MDVKDITVDNDKIVSERYTCSESHADKGRHPLNRFKGFFTRKDEKLEKDDYDGHRVETTQEKNGKLQAPEKDTLAIVTDQSVFEYDFSHAKRGVAVLVIYTKFADGNSDRTYADSDTVNMRSMFKSLGFSVTVLENYTKCLLVKTLNDIRRTMSTDVDCFACVLSSHGTESLGKDKLRSHYIYTSDGTIETSSIVEHFGSESCWQLNGKPKLFFIQACRSKFAAKDGTNNDPGVSIQVCKTGKLVERKLHLSQQPLTNTSKMDAKHSVDAYSSFPFADDDMPSGNTQMNEASNGRFNQETKQTILGYCKIPRQSTENYQRNTSSQHRYQNRRQQGTSPGKSELRYIDEVEFYDVPCYKDCLVMFSSPPELLAWSNEDIGGWLPHCLLCVKQELESNNFKEDFLQVLTRVSSKMALDMETFCADSVYNKNKSVACIYHKLTKDVILSKKMPPTVTSV